jgi:hypothetical protein
MSLAMTKPEREAFLADVHVGVISIPEPGRGPLTVPVWYSSRSRIADAGCGMGRDSRARKRREVTARDRAASGVRISRRVMTPSGRRCSEPPGLTHHALFARRRLDRTGVNRTMAQPLPASPEARGLHRGRRGVLPAGLRGLRSISLRFPAQDIRAPSEPARHDA